MNKTGKKCIECGEETFAIRMIDRGQQNIHYELAFADAEGKRKFGKGYNFAGVVAAELCNNCGRITLRASTDE